MTGLWRLRVADEVVATAARSYPRQVRGRLTCQINYLQIVQCWRDDQNNGPDRTRCQFCGLSVGWAGTAAIQ